MPPAAHALLGASSAHRWLACPPSARLEEQKPDSTSEAAAEGTLAHELVELKLKRFLAGRKTGKATPKIAGHELYRPVMEEYTDEYVDYVLALFSSVKETCGDARLISERRVDFSDVVPDGFGTSDTIIIADDVMHVVDFKYGKGLMVEAAGNPQLRLYAWGAYREFGVLYDIRKVVVHIVQPRLDHISSEEMTLEALEAWVKEIVLPTARQAYQGEGEFCAGEHCRFCRVQATCRAYADHVMRMTQYQFADPVELTDEEIADILRDVDDLVRWAKMIKDYAQDEAVSHDHFIPGYKLVEGRSVRRITDAGKAAGLLLEAGYAQDNIYTLKGIGDLEAVVGKKALGELLGDLITKPAGKPVLVPESDKRPAISSDTRAAELFNDDIQ